MAQGDPEAPTNFALILEDPLEEFEALCLQEGWGVPLVAEDRVVLREEDEGPKRRRKQRYKRGELLPVLVWADNYWIFGLSDVMIGKMATAWHDMLGKYGFEVDNSACKWISTVDDKAAREVFVEDVRIDRVKRNDGLLVLGALVTSTTAVRVR